MDLKLQLEESKKAYGGVLEMRKVKAHQDERKRYEDMEFEEKMNKECDEAAKAKARSAELLVAKRIPGEEEKQAQIRGKFT